MHWSYSHNVNFVLITFYVAVDLREWSMLCMHTNRYQVLLKFYCKTWISDLFCRIWLLVTVLWQNLRFSDCAIYPSFLYKFVFVNFHRWDFTVGTVNPLTRLTFWLPEIYSYECWTVNNCEGCYQSKTSSSRMSSIASANRGQCNSSSRQLFFIPQQTLNTYGCRFSMMTRLLIMIDDFFST